MGTSQGSRISDRRTPPSGNLRLKKTASASPIYAAEVTVPDGAGPPAATFRVRRDGDVLRVAASGTDRPFAVRVAGGARAGGAGEVALPSRWPGERVGG